MRADIGSYEWYQRLWFTESNWRRSKRGNFYFAGPTGRATNTCTVFHRSDGWNYLVVLRSEPDFGPGGYKTRNQARDAAFDYAMKESGLVADEA